MKKLSSGIVIFLTSLLFLTSHAVARDKVRVSSLTINNSPEGTFSGSFTKNGQTIFFEAIRGEENHSEDPDAPRFAVDVRIMDVNHHPFVVRSGGEKMINPQWSEDQKIAENLTTNDEDRLADFYLLADLHRALKALQRRTHNQTPELEELLNCLEGIEEDDFFHHESSEMDSNLTERSSARAKSYKYTFKAEIRKRPVDNTPCSSFFKKCLAEHSALRVKIYNSDGKLKFTFVSCNHSTCADSSKMSTKCTKEWKRDNLAMYAFENMCDGLTPYGINPNTHTCNTDTELQYRTAKRGYFNAWEALTFCLLPRFSAPSCD